MSPRVSVVVPSYRHERFVREAVESALSDLVEVEVVVVDDGSTDGSPDLLREMATGEPRIRLLEQENRGAHAALNRGLTEARGELIFILNSDDRFAADRIPRFVERFDAEPDLLTLGSWLRIIDDGGNEIGCKEGDRTLPPWPPRNSRRRLAELGDPRASLLETNYLSTSSNLAFRRSLVDDGLTFPPLRYTHDWYFALAAATRGRLEIVPEPLVDYRVHGHNTIREGADAEAGERAMHFEILWTLAAWSHHLRQRLVERADHDRRDLAERQWRSLPPFVEPTRFSQLLLLRGPGPEPPSDYSSLLEEDHPVRRAIVGANGARGDGPTSDVGPRLSVVIPTRDRLASLRHTLGALRREIEPNGALAPTLLEVIVVDDGSRESVPPDWRDELAPLDVRIHPRPPLGPAAARNWGIERARAERVLLLGDDTPPRPGALAVHLAPEHAGHALQGRIDWDPDEPVTDLMQFLAPAGPQFYFVGLEEGSEVPYTGVLGSNLSAPTAWFRREPFDEGFPHASFEDTELAYRWRRRGWTTRFSDAAGAWHRHRYDELGPFLERQHRAGGSARRAVLRHPTLLWRIVLAPAIVTLRRRLRRHPDREQRWDLACRGAFLRGVLGRPLPNR